MGASYPLDYVGYEHGGGLYARNRVQVFAPHSYSQQPKFQRFSVKRGRNETLEPPFEDHNLYPQSFNEVRGMSHGIGSFQEYGDEVLDGIMGQNFPMSNNFMSAGAKTDQFDIGRNSAHPSHSRKTMKSKKSKKNKYS